MVQLKQEVLHVVVVREGTFQFLHGPIKANYIAYAYPSRIKFQFLHGPIKAKQKATPRKTFTKVSIPTWSN